MWKTGSLASREKWVTIKSCLCINWHIHVCISLHDLKICLSLSLLLQSREMRSPVRDTPLKCEIGGDPGPAGPTTGETCYCGRGIGVARFTWHCYVSWWLLLTWERGNYHEIGKLITCCVDLITCCDRQGRNIFTGSFSLYRSIVIYMFMEERR